MKVLCVMGTRPEAIKMAPVILALKKEPWANVRVLATAQHRHMLDQVNVFFGIAPDIDLNIMRPNQALTTLTARLLLELDGVELVFEEDALRSIAKKALERNTGARGLRSIIENIMLDIMFDIPSRDEIVKCVITDNTVNGIGAPLLFDEDGKQIN